MTLSVPQEVDWLLTDRSESVEEAVGLGSGVAWDAWPLEGSEGMGPNSKPWLFATDRSLLKSIGSPLLE